MRAHRSGTTAVARCARSGEVATDVPIPAVEMPTIELPHQDVQERCDAAFELIRQLCSNRKSFPVLLVTPEGAEATSYEVPSPANILRSQLDEHNDKSPRGQVISYGVEALEPGQHTADTPMLPEDLSP